MLLKKNKTLGPILCRLGAKRCTRLLMLKIDIDSSQMFIIVYWPYHMTLSTDTQSLIVSVMALPIILNSCSRLMFHQVLPFMKVIIHFISVVHSISIYQRKKECYLFLVFYKTSSFILQRFILAGFISVFKMTERKSGNCPKTKYFLFNRYNREAIKGRQGLGEVMIYIYYSR